MSMRVEGFGLGNVVRRDCRLADHCYFNEPSSYSWDGYERYLRDNGYEAPTCAWKMSERVHVVANLGVICIASSPTSKPLPIPDVPRPRVSFLTGPYKSLNGHGMKLTSYLLFRQVYDDFINRTRAEQYGMEYTLYELANNVGFNTIDEVMSNICPCVPDEVRCFAEYIGLTHLAGTRLLRPMVIEY